jgi:predicted Zn-dependent peptidase
MNDSVYQKSFLRNSVRVVTEYIPHVRSISTGIWVDAGSRDEEEDEGGMSHLVEHMIFKGTDKRSALDIAKELDSIGGMSNAFTCQEQTCFHAKVLDTHLAKVVDLLLDIFRNSLFKPEDLEREKLVVLQEISMVEDTPDEYVHVLFNRSFWGENPLGRPILGDAGIVKGFNQQKIINYIVKCYLPSRLVKAPAGHIDHHRFVDLLRASLEEMNQENGYYRRQTALVTKEVNVHVKPLEQVHVCLGVRGPAAVDEFRFVDTLLSTILGGNMSSRLFQKIREERGLAYSVYSHVSTYSDVGLLGVYMGVRPDSLPEALDLVFKEFDKLRAGQLDQSELDAAKDYLKGSILLSAENTDNRMGRLAKNELLFQRFVSFEEVLKRIDEVGIDQVGDRAGMRLDPQGVSVTVLGPWDKDLAFLP